MVLDARPAMSELFAVEDKAGNQKQIAPVWNEIIVPKYGDLSNIVYANPSYTKQLRTGELLDEIEESTYFAAFASWTADAESELKWCLGSIKEVLRRQVTSVIPTGTAIKKLQKYRGSRTEDRGGGK